MTTVSEVDVEPYDTAALRSEIPINRWDSLVASAESQVEGKTHWHINSTSAGGGVAEMLHPMVGLARAVGLSMRWLVIEAPTAFFEITKRVDNGVSGVPGDSGPLGADESALYERVSAQLSQQISRFVGPGDRVILHDPQTAGLCSAIRALGATVVWRAHNGSDQPNEHTTTAWNFLRRHIEHADGLVATRDTFRPPVNSEIPYTSIAPFIDPTVDKNITLSDVAVREHLERWGIIAGRTSIGRAPRGYELYREGPPPSPHRQMVVQVSRWDRVKDMAGVIDSFRDSVAPFTDAYLTLAGPEVSGVADDPEAADYLAHCVRQWRALPRDIRRRVQLVCLPMQDMSANALAVNALQRHAAVITQKSRSEGFGLTVAEAMWKTTPVVATAVGGIQLQIPSSQQGRTVDIDAPDDLFGATVRHLLSDPRLRRALGHSGRDHIKDRFLLDTALIEELQFLDSLALEVTA